MAEVQQPVQEAPAAVAPTHEPTAATATANEAIADPIRSQGTNELSPESRPELGAAGTTDGTTAAVPTAPNVTNVPKEEKVGKGETLVEAHPINEGILNYKGPGLKGLLFSKKYFWFRDAPLEPKHLSAYLGNEKSKDIAHPNAAHAQQTGKGLLFFAKRAEDKDHPQGIFNLADITDVVKGNFNDFGFSLHGHKHQFQAITKPEKDSWIVALETKAADAKNSREGIVGSSGYKGALEKYGAPAAAATSGTSRSLSRPGKKASKSRERKTAATKSDSVASPVADTKTSNPADTTSEITPESTANQQKASPSGAEKAGEAAIGGATVGGIAGAAATRSGSTSEEDRKTKKSRSQSRNKRGSLFGNLLAKKEDHDVKKEIKKEEKEEKKEEKAEEKAIKKEVKKEEKAEEKEEKAELKSEKKELKEEAKEEKNLEKEGNPLTTGHTPGFNAHDVASRVVGEPVVPVEGKSSTVTDAAPATGTGTATTEPLATETAPIISTKEAAPKPNKRASLFGGFFGKKETATPTTTEIPPVVPAKDEPSTAPSATPQPNQTGNESTVEPTTEFTAVAAPAAAAEPTTPGATTTPTDKRRTSFFGNLGTKKERKAGAASGDESSGGFGGLLRKASRAQKGNPAAKDAADVPLPKQTPAETATTEGAAEEKAAVTDGEVPPNPKSETQEPSAVSAAA